MVADGSTSARAHAIERFARLLRELRETAGNPSFRELAGRSSAISHTTLHEAAQGNRLPSWPTTVEFVKACGADPADYRDRWQEADATVRGTCADVGRSPGDVPSDPVPSDATPSDPGEPVAAEQDDAAPVPESRPTTAGDTAGAVRRRRLVLAGVAALALAAGAVVGALVARGSDDTSSAQQASPLKSPGDCKIQQSAPPSVSPAHSGDAGVFVLDVTLPDCAHIEPGSTVLKIWRFRNVGSVTWRGYLLHRIDPQARNQCQTITDIPVPLTAPGKTVDVRAYVTAPRTAGLCFVRFKMEDAAGRIAFPAGRPVYFSLIVD